MIINPKQLAYAQLQAQQIQFQQQQIPNYLSVPYFVQKHSIYGFQNHYNPPLFLPYTQNVNYQVFNHIGVQLSYNPYQTSNQQNSIPKLYSLEKNNIQKQIINNHQDMKMDSNNIKPLNPCQQTQMSQYDIKNELEGIYQQIDSQTNEKAQENVNMKKKLKQARVYNRNQKFSYTQKQKKKLIIRSKSSMKKSSKKQFSKRQKTRKQLNYLKILFNYQPNWSKNTMAKISKKLRMPQSKVYKWNWDKKQKIKNEIVQEMIHHNYLKTIFDIKKEDLDEELLINKNNNSNNEKSVLFITTKPKKIDNKLQYLFIEE